MIFSASLSVLALLLVHVPHGVQSFSPHACSHQRRTASGVIMPTTTTSLHATTEDTSATTTTQKTKLSRPERKKLEREKKQKKKNGKKQPEQAKYTLHSNNISELTPSSNADDVMKAIKRAQNRHDDHDLRIVKNFLVNEVDDHFAYGFRGSLLARLAVGALHMNSNDIARDVIDVRKEYHRDSMLPMESAAIIRGLLRIHNVTDALDILDDELAVPDDEETLDSSENKELLKQRASSIASIASRHFFEGEPSMAVRACTMLTELGPIIRKCGLTAEEINMPWTRIIQGASECESGRRAGTISPCDPEIALNLPCNLVYCVLKAMTTFPSDNDDRTYEALSNALVRRTLFITGAVSMEGCPDADRGEVVFMGRSNVGKSSLVNMVTNRKSLAYTSKRPGKTQQFNYFAVNDKPGREKEVRYGDEVRGEKDPDAFYILDVPGFGFAKVPEKQRQEWSDFLSEYIETRKTLRVIFHLIDGRHGPIDEDFNIMKQVGEQKPKGVQYVIVLTKADKNIKGPNTTNSGKVQKKVLDKLRIAAKENGVGTAPILLTSAETKLGRDDMWRYMRLAAEV
mmetsp:Transcript_241/g.432  ORF Transcript_241/g.432 Transcript_241/m.432 type:complete len:571 (+) Transcript_241:130-1842(+)